MSDDLREWLKTIPVVTDADKAELREAITKLEAQQRGTRNAETMLCEMLEVDDGSQILDAIHGLKERIRRLEEESESRWKLAEAAVSSCSELEERIKRLVEAGDRLLWMAPPGLKGSKAVCAKEAWTKAKEAKP